MARAWKSNIALVLLMMGCYAALMGYRNAAIAIALVQKHMLASEVGINGLGQCAAMLASAAALPRLINAYGCRAACVLALTVECVALAGLAVFDSFTAWFVIRTLLGVSTAALCAAGEAWIGSLAHDGHKGRVMGLYTAAVGVGLSLGPALYSLGALARLSPFLLIWGLAAAVAAPLMFARSHQTKTTAANAGYSLLEFLRRAPLVTALFILIGMKDTAQSTFLPVLGVQSGMSSSSATLLLSACLLGGVSIPAFIGSLSDKINKRLLLGVVCFAFGVCALGLLVTLPHPILRLVNCFLLGGFGSSVFAVAMAFVGSEFKGADLTTAYVATGALWGVGSLAGNVFVGGAMGLLDSVGFSFILGLPFIVFSLIMVRYARARVATSSGNVV